MIGLIIVRKKFENKEIFNFVKFMLIMRKWNDIFLRKLYGFVKIVLWYFGVDFVEYVLWCL